MTWISFDDILLPFWALKAVRARKASTSLGKWRGEFPPMANVRRDLLLPGPPFLRESSLPKMRSPPFAKKINIPPAIGEATEATVCYSVLFAENGSSLRWSSWWLSISFVYLVFQLISIAKARPSTSFSYKKVRAESNKWRPRGYLTPTHS